MVIKLFVEEAGSQQARRVLGDTDPLLAPTLILAEVGNVVWRLSRRDELSDEQVTGIPLELSLLFDDLVPLRGLLVPGLALVRSLDHPIYECFYLALARERGVPLVTAGRWLLARVAGSGLAPARAPAIAPSRGRRG